MLALAALAGCGSNARPPSPSAPAAVAFVDVTVVPMDRERELPHQTVVVQGGRIVALGDVNALTPPPHAQRIDGRGRFLVPGLADAHAHLDTAAALTLLVANGVTFVRNLWGTPLHLAWRTQIARGERLGPAIYTAGTIVDGDPPTWPGSTIVANAGDAEAVVEQQKEEGYQLIKVYNRLTPSAYTALVAAARRAAMPLEGHVPTAVPLMQALAGGQRTIDHLTGYLVALQADDSPFRGTTALVHRRHLAEHVDWRKLPALVAATKQAGVWNCPTLTVDQWFVPPDELARERARPELRLVPPWMLASWAPSEEQQNAGPAEFAKNRHAADVLGQITLALHRAGARLVLGTDSPNPFMVPGFAVHRELANLVRAGLSPYAALRSATADAAELLGHDGGVIAAGRRADLVLVDGDPLRDLGTLAHPRGVLVSGRWLDRAELDRLLDALAASYRAPRDRFAGLPPLDGDGAVVDSYAIVIDGVPVGGERVAERRNPDGTHTILAQAITDAPDATRYQVRLDVGSGYGDRLAIDGQGALGETHVVMVRDHGRLRVSGRAPGFTAPLDVPIGDHVFLGSPLLADRLLIFARLGEAGSTARVKQLVLDPEVAIFDSTLEIARLPPVHGSEHAARHYAIVERERRSRETQELLLKPGGRPLRYIQKERRGEVEYRLLDVAASVKPRELPAP